MKFCKVLGSVQFHGDVTITFGGVTRDIRQGDKLDIPYKIDIEAPSGVLIGELIKAGFEFVEGSYD